MKKILITAGPTNEYIDKVMKITNMSTGSTGLELANYFCEKEWSVTLIATNSVFNHKDFNTFNLGKNLQKSIRVETTKDLLIALEKEKGDHYDFIVHSAAVGDYTPEFCFDMNDLANELLTVTEFTKENILSILRNPKCKIDDTSKIDSHKKDLTVKLKLTPKLIANLRNWFPKAKIFGFKLLENVSQEQLIDVAADLCTKNCLDYVLANDLNDISKGHRILHLVSAENKKELTFNSIRELAVFIQNKK